MNLWGCWVITSKVTGDRVTAKLEEAGIVWVRVGERVEQGGSKRSCPRTAKAQESVSNGGGRRQLEGEKEGIQVTARGGLYRQRQSMEIGRGCRYIWLWELRHHPGEKKEGRCRLRFSIKKPLCLADGIPREVKKDETSFFFVLFVALFRRSVPGVEQHRGC